MIKTSLPYDELKQISQYGRLAEAAVAARNLTEFFEALREQLTELLPHDVLMLFTYEPGSMTFHLPPELNKHINLPASAPHQLQEEHTSFKRFLHAPSPLLRSDEGAESAYSEHEREILGDCTAAGLSVPIYHDDDLLGVLHLARRQPIKFNKLQRALGTIAAGFCAGFIHQERLQDKLKLTVEAEQVAQDRFRALFENISGPCCVVELGTGMIQSANRRLARFLQREAAELVGVSIYDLVPPETRETLLTAMAAVEEKGLVKLASGSVILQNGNTSQVGLTLSAVPHSKDEILLRLVNRQAMLRRRNREMAAWKHLKHIVEAFQAEALEAGFEAALEKGLSRLAQAVAAKYVALFLEQDGKIMMAHAVRRRADDAGQLSKAWRAGLARGPYHEILQENATKFYTNLHREKTFTNLRPIARQLNFDSMLTVPLNIEGKPGAVLAAYFGEKRAITPREVCFVEIAVQALAEGLTSRKIQETVHRREAHSAAIQRLANRLTATISLPEILETFAPVVHGIINFDLLDVSLFESDREATRIYSIVSRKLLHDLGEENPAPLPERQDLCWLARGETRESALHAEIEGRTQEKRNVLLMSNEKYLGTLEFSSLERNAFGPEQDMFLEQIANHLALAIENNRLFSKLNNRLKDLSCITNASWSVVKKRDSQIVLGNILRSIQKALQASSCLFVATHAMPTLPKIVKVGESGLTLDWPHWSTIDRKHLSKKQFVTFESVAAAFEDDAFSGAMLAYRVDAQQTNIGKIVVMWDAPRQFHRREMELVRTMANICATAIDNAALRYERQQHTSELEKVNQELEKFVYTVSHDLKSPVISIQGFTNLLLEDHVDEFSPDAKHYLDRVHENAIEMEKLIKDLLKLSQVGRVANLSKKVQIQGVVDRALVEFSFQLKKQNIEVSVSDSLPDVFGDATQLTQVFANLIGNAIKFMRPEEADPKIEIGARTEDDKAIFWVADNGRGIRKEHQAAIFKLFERSKRDPDIEGSGIGLAIVKRVIENHKGRVWVESEEGKGATFFFTLPISPPAAGPDFLA